jgi:hypothetical protein
MVALANVRSPWMTTRIVSGVPQKNPSSFDHIAMASKKTAAPYPQGFLQVNCRNVAIPLLSVSPDVLCG